MSERFQNLPQPTGLYPFHLSLSTILTDQAMQQIRDSAHMVFHAVGDTGGVNTPTPQELVARFMESDFAASGDVSGNPSFLYHLGDVIYYAGESQNYYWEFYEPYNQYPAPIFAIPGNHDGDVDPLAPAPSLQAFVRNFCAQAPVHTPEAMDSPREAMTQPNVYWTLDAELATIIGLYSNCPEGGQMTAAQIDWFASELQNAPQNRALIVAVHHPVFSAYGPHPGSQHLYDVFQQAFTTTGRIPNLILCGHVHNYQRFSGMIAGQEVVFVVAGAGGYNTRLHTLAREFHALPLPIQMAGSEGTLENFCDSRHGYLKVEVTAHQIHCDYFAVPNIDPSIAKLPPNTPFDSFDIGF
jgi:hypothetical protein